MCEYRNIHALMSPGLDHITMLEDYNAFGTNDRHDGSSKAVIARDIERTTVIGDRSSSMSDHIKQYRTYDDRSEERALRVP